MSERAPPLVGETDPELDFGLLSPTLLGDMAAASRDFLDCQRQLRERGQIVTDLFSERRFYPSDHYPKGDVYDARSHSQYYFHRHRGDEHGHFHTFLRPKGMPGDIRPAEPADRRLSEDDDNPSHLVAIAIDDAGQPGMLFTTNRWVTAETWYKASDVKRMLPCFRIGHDRPSGLLNRWVGDLVVLFRPQIERLLDERDATVERYRHRLPGIPVLDDRELEITSMMRIDPVRQTALILQSL